MERRSYYLFPMVGYQPPEYPGLHTEIPWDRGTRQLAKDVRSDDHGRLWSLTANPKDRMSLHREWWVQYFPGRWVSGLYGPIFIHARLEEDNYIYRGARQAWSILAWNVRQIAVIPATPFAPEVLHRFWREYPHFQGRKMQSLPPRVHVADRIMLVRRLA